MNSHNRTNTSEDEEGHRSKDTDEVKIEIRETAIMDEVHTSEKSKKDLLIMALITCIAIALHNVR